jgi:hypothetical protein
MSDAKFQSFDEFWPFYLGEHKDPVNRGLHYVGTSLAIGTVTAAVVTVNPAWLLLTPVVGYAPAWIGHFVIEGNRPATFKHPLWSLRGDLRMLSLFLSGRITDELDRLHILDAPPPAAATSKDAKPAEAVHTNGTTSAAATA